MAEIGVKIIWTWCPVCWVRTEHHIVKQDQICTNCQTTTNLSLHNVHISLPLSGEKQETQNPPFTQGALPAR